LSLGGMIAQRLALTRPELVGALILASTTCRIPSNSREHMESRLSAMRDRGPAAAAEVAAKSIYSAAWRSDNPDTLAAFIKWRAAQDQTGLVNAMLATSEFDVSAKLDQIKVPTLVVTGSQDTLIRPDAQADIAEHIPGARLEVIQDAGHILPVEAPDAFNRIVDGFLARHWSPSSRQ
jgi:3-oxoadipate enol-lactonase